jgi:hypothetical protein
MQAASIYFGKGLYENSVTSTVATDGGQLKVGLRSGTMSSYYWVIFDNFRLCYFGSMAPDVVDGISTVETEAMPVVRTGVYSIDGRKLLPDMKGIHLLPRGLYIVNGKAVVCGKE